MSPRDLPLSIALSAAKMAIEKTHVLNSQQQKKQLTLLSNWQETAPNGHQVL